MIMDYLEEWSYLAVFVLGSIPWIELVAVIPLGVVFGLNPIAVAVLGFAGNWLTMFMVIALFDRLQRWWGKKRSGDPQESKRGKRARAIWERYGLPGLAIVGPLLIGSHIAAAVAMAFKAPRVAVTAWMSFSLALWTIVLAVVAYFGFDFLGIIRTDFFSGD
ncbi:small multi-drug export protein [Paenibacillus senegalensis]|uniref:small multi-drug export protein n=1 Tax=Paenibacillus senegalensis TaxID=1465766 RepID=UPI000288001E|nr:small multi-drug export protein [Paenibacillus senegalensis]